MSISDEQYERIVHFLEGRMTREERAAFLEEAAVNRELHEELEWERVLRGKDDLLPEALVFNDDPSAEIPAEKQRQVAPFYKNTWLIAASILGILLIGAAVFLLRPRTERPGIVKNRPVENKDSAARHGNSSPDTIIAAPSIDYQLAYTQFYRQFNSTADLPPDLENVELAYVQKDYSRVIEEATTISATRGQGTVNTQVKAYAGLYKGVALMELHETGKAVAAFRAALKTSPESVVRDELQWYLALCYVKQERKQESVRLLENLVKTGSRKNEASLLLQKLQPGK